MTVANPHEQFEPKNGVEALEDTTRYLASQMPRAEVIRLIEEMDPTRIMHAVRGEQVEPPLSPVEAQLAITVDHYKDFMSPPIGAVALLEGLRHQVLDGEVFVGEPLPDSHYAQQA